MEIGREKNKHKKKAQAMGLFHPSLTAAPPRSPFAACGAQQNPPARGQTPSSALILPPPPPSSSTSMAAFLTQAALIFFFFFFLLCPQASTISHSLPITPLAFKCSPLRQPPIDLHLLRSLLGALTREASHAGFAASWAAAGGGDTLHGLTQCRPDLPQAACAACLSAAARALVFSLCMGSPAASGWFADGCYLHYYYGSLEGYFLREGRPFEARSNGTYAPDRVGFPPAAGALLRRLAAEAGLPSRRGFSYGEVSYGDGGGRVYAVVECLRSVPLEQCRACLTGAAAMARACCGRMEGGLAVAGDCTVRFESHRFLSYVAPAGAAGPGPSAGATTAMAATTTTTYEEDGEGDGATGLKGKVVLLPWFVGVACFVGVALGLWQLRRRVLSVKVAAATLPEDMADEGEKENK